jgi:hypothetical protein
MYCFFAVVKILHLGGEHSEDKSISMAILRHASKHDEII